ncbi:MAG: winged helix-turn-helix domain-containing protein, partial [Myxococcota bacterium]
MTAESLQLAAGQLNFERRVLSRSDGSEQRLTDLEIRVLRFLATHAGTPVGRGELHAALWNPSASLRQVDDCIRRIRRKIERDPTTPEHLKSIWGVGYALLTPQEGPIAPPAAAAPLPESHTIRLGSHTVVNLTAHELVRQRQVVRLTANEVSLLTLLVEARGHPVERTRLIRKIFGVVGERSLESLVRRLRVKIEDDPSNPRWLHTL